MGTILIAPLMMLATIFMKMKDPINAEKYYRKAIKIDHPQSYKAYFRLGTLLMAVFDATAFNFVSSDDSTIDEEMGYEFDPPIPASATQITDSNGEVYWIVRLEPDNCHNTNPDDPDVFTCDNIYMRAFLLDPLNGESADLNTTLYKNCQP